MTATKIVVVTIIKYKF